jgi:hypothetical protein
MTRVNALGDATMIPLLRRFLLFLAVTMLLPAAVRADDPTAIDPFGPRQPVRDDALPGYLELSDGTVHPGRLYLTRDARLKIFDDQQQRQREVPLSAIKRIDSTVQKEWLEKEWRFKENANDEKVYTGHSYPAREYVHTITLKDGRTIKGALSGIVYVQPEEGEAERYIFHKRDKGELDTDLKSLLYVRSVRLGEDALEEGKEKAVKRGARAK